MPPIALYILAPPPLQSGSFSFCPKVHVITSLTQFLYRANEVSRPYMGLIFILFCSFYPPGKGWGSALREHSWRHPETIWDARIQSVLAMCKTKLLIRCTSTVLVFPPVNVCPLPWPSPVPSRSLAMAKLRRGFGLFRIREQHPAAVAAIWVEASSPALTELPTTTPLPQPLL